MVVFLFHKELRFTTYKQPILRLYTAHSVTSLQLGMDTFKNEAVLYDINTNETVQYLNCTVNDTLLHYSLINFVMNSHV